MAKSVLKGSDRLQKTLAGIGKDLQGGWLKRVLGRFLGRSVRLPHLEIGFFEDAQYPDGTYVAQVAYWDEYGTEHSLARPFMRVTISKHQNEWSDLLASALEKSGGNLDKALGILGRIIADQVREQIKETNGPPNSAVTNLLKQRFPKGDYTAADYFKARHDAANGADAPAGEVLIWSGQMYQSVNSQVVSD